MSRGKQTKLFHDIQMGNSDSHRSRAILESLENLTGLHWKTNTYTPTARFSGSIQTTDYEIYLPTRAEVYRLETLLSAHGLQPEVVDGACDNDRAGISLSEKSATKLMHDRFLQRQIHADMKKAGFAAGAFLA